MYVYYLYNQSIILNQVTCIYNTIIICILFYCSVYSMLLYTCLYTLYIRPLLAVCIYVYKAVNGNVPLYCTVKIYVWYILVYIE